MKELYEKLNTAIEELDRQERYLDKLRKGLE